MQMQPHISESFQVEGQSTGSKHSQRSVSRYRQFMVNTASNVLFKVFATLLGLLLIPIFVQRMGPELYGIWVLNFTILSYFYVVDTSFAGAVVRHISQASAEDVRLQAQVVNTALAVYTAFGLAIGTILAMLGGPLVALLDIEPQYGSVVRSLLVISGLSAVVLWPLLVFPSVLKGLLQHVKLNLIQGVSVVVSQVALIVAINQGVSLEGCLTIFFAVLAASGVALLVVVWRAIPGLRIDPRLVNTAILGEITRFSLGLFFMELVGILAFQADTLLIAYFLSLAAITKYDIVTKVFFQLRQFYGMFLGVVQPMIFAADHEGDHKFIDRMLIKGMKYINIGYIPLIVLGVVVCKSFITVWMGPEYGRLGHWGAFYLLQYLLSPVIGVAGTVLVGMSKLKSINVLNVISVTLNVGVSIWAIGYVGFAGVLVGTVAATYLMAPISYSVYCKLAAVNWREPLRQNWRISLVHVVVFLCPGYLFAQRLIAGWTSLVIFSGVFLLLEFLVMYIFFVNPEERERIRNLVKRSNGGRRQLAL